jgi:hypothetical protein
MRRDHQDGLDVTQLGAQGVQLRAQQAGFQGEGGRAVGNEEKRGGVVVHGFYCIGIE